MPALLTIGTEIHSGKRRFRVSAITKAHVVLNQTHPQNGPDLQLDHATVEQMLSASQSTKAAAQDKVQTKAEKKAKRAGRGKVAA